MGGNIKKTFSDVRMAHAFLFIVLIILLALMGWVIKPFVIDIILAGIVASFFYPVYRGILKVIKSAQVASLITTLLIAALLFVPIINFGIYFVFKGARAYQDLIPFIQNPEFLNHLNVVMGKVFDFLGMDNVSIIEIIKQFLGTINTLILTLTTGILSSTSQLIVSILIIFLTIYFLFVDGKTLIRKMMTLTPLPNQYDHQIFKTFREVSFSTIISTFLVAIFQGLLGGIGFLLVGLPAFFPGILMAISSILPYVGAALIWVPTVIYFFYTGAYTNAIILIIIGLIVSFGDNILRAYIIKGKTQVHEMIIFFSLIGGLVAFGFWGIVLGPLLVSLLLTVLSIYEKEFSGVLEKSKD